MKIYEFTRSISETSNGMRISEYACSGVIDSDGNIILSNGFGHIYPTRIMNNGIGEEPTDMSIKSQQANMKTIHSLISQDLGYIYGERESGPNGAKKQFHTKSAAFLRALGNDLGFKDFKVTNNYGGIAVSGEIILKGMWNDSNGLYLQLFQSVTNRREFLYRHITHMKDYTGSSNQWLPCEMFADAEYERLVDTLLRLRTTPRREHYVA